MAKLRTVPFRMSRRTRGISALGQKRTSRHVRVMSVIPLKVDIHQCGLHVRLVPKATSRKRRSCFFCSSNPHVAFLLHFLHMRVTSISSP